MSKLTPHTRSTLQRKLWAAIPTTAIVALVASTGAATAQQSPVAATEAATANAAQLIKNFARASDRRDAPALEALLHPSFRVVFNVKPGTPPTVLERAQYLQMVRDGKIGGPDRSVTVFNVAFADGFASGTSRMVHANATFQSVFALIQSEGQWQLLQEAVLMTPAGAAK
jgi:Domain of unknown function (DUF4440)